MDARAALLELKERIERRYDPGQLRDSEGKWTDGPVGAAATYTLDAFRRLYGDEVDDRYAGDFYVSVHERGDFVLSFMHEDGKREILLDGLNAERANAIADGLDWAATAHLSDDDENDPDTGLVDYAEVDDGIVVGYTEVGDVSLRLPKDDDARPGVPDEYEVLDIDASDATDLERALRDMADAYDELGDEEDGGDGVTEEPQPARARVLALADEIRRKYNPGQLRDPGGEGGGQWVKSPGAAAEAASKDLLELAGRIDLDPREKLVSSDRLNGDNGGDVDLNWAVVHSPAGNEVRLGVIPHFDADKWRAGDHGGTAILDDGQVRKLREDLRGAVAEAKTALKEAADRFDPDEGLPANPTERDKVLFGLEPVARGVLQTDWEDLHWNVYLSDQEDEPWLLSIGAGDPDTNEADPVQFAPKKVGKLLTSLGRIESDLAETSRSRRGLSRTYAADGGGTRTGKETTTNTGPKGGQFAPGGGRVGGKGKPPPKRRPAKKAPAKPAGPLGYDGKTGAGYGIKGGDPRVRTLQSVLNRFDLKDGSGQPLAVDGKFGPRTTAAVKRLQRAMGEEPTGKVTEDFIKRVANAKSLEELRPPKPAPKVRKRVRRSVEHLHVLVNGICRTCRPSTLTRRFDPHQLRIQGGEHGGEWTKSGGIGTVKDTLRLADRIELAPGERLAGSSRAVDRNGDSTAVFAAIEGPSGRRLRFGVVVPEDARRWRAANKGGTIELDEHGTAELRRVVSDAVATGKKNVADYRAELRKARADGLPESEWPDPEADIASGVIKGAAWGDVQWRLTREEGPEYGDYGPGGEWTLSLKPVPSTSSLALDPFYIDSPGVAKKVLGALNFSTDASRAHRHRLDNGICRTCIPQPEHQLVNGICQTCS